MIRLLGGWSRFAGMGALAFAILYAYGLLLSVLGGGWVFVIGREPWPLPWWGMASAPLGIGIAALLMELLGGWLMNGFAVTEAGQPQWRRWIGLILLVTLLAALMFGALWFQG